MRHLVLYEGLLNGDVRASLLGVLSSVRNDGITKGELKKLCGVALELLDNAQRYASGEIRFEWCITVDRFTIKVVNQASKEDANRLLDAVERTNELTPAQVKATLMEQLMNGEFGEKGGAGLGFLQIANRTRGDLNATIRPIANKLYQCESTFNLKRA